MLDIIEHPTKRRPAARGAAPVCFVLHNTGESDLDEILKVYESGVGPNYLIETHGAIRRFVPDDRIAWHAGMKGPEVRLYRRGWAVWSVWHWSLDANEPHHVGHEFEGYAEWRGKWFARGVKTPTQLLTGEFPNQRSIGIELQKPIAAQRTADLFTDAQYTALEALLADRAAVLNIPLDVEHVLGHSDVSPMRRTTEKGGFDPGRAFNWSRVLV